MGMSKQVLGIAVVVTLTTAGVSATAGYYFGQDSIVTDVRLMMEANSPRVKLSCANGIKIITDNVTVNEPDLFSRRAFRPLQMQPVMQDLEQGGCAIVPYLAYHYISTERRDKNNPDIAGEAEPLNSSIAIRLGLMEEEDEIDWSKPAYEEAEDDSNEDSKDKTIDPNAQYIEDGVNSDGIPYKAGDPLPE